MGALACSTVTMGALASGYVLRVALVSTDFMGALAYSNSTATIGTLACGAVIMGTFACSTPCMGTLAFGSAFRIIMGSTDFMGTRQLIAAFSCRALLSHGLNSSSPSHI